MININALLSVIILICFLLVIYALNYVRGAMFGAKIVTFCEDIDNKSKEEILKMARKANKLYYHISDPDQHELAWCLLKIKDLFDVNIDDIDDMKRHIKERLRSMKKR